MPDLFESPSFPRQLFNGMFYVVHLPTTCKCFVDILFLFINQDVGPLSGGGDEGYFVPPVKGTSQSQVVTELVC